MVKEVIENVRFSSSGEFIEKILNPVIQQLIQHNQMVWLISKWIQDYNDYAPHSDLNMQTATECFNLNRVA